MVGRLRIKTGTLKAHQIQRFYRNSNLTLKELNKLVSRLIWHRIRGSESPSQIGSESLRTTKHYYHYEGRDCWRWYISKEFQDSDLWYTNLQRDGWYHSWSNRTVHNPGCHALRISPNTFHPWVGACSRNFSTAACCCLSMIMPARNKLLRQ